MLKLVVLISFCACAVTATLPFDVFSGNVDSRIYNGMRATRGQVPHQAFLYLAVNGTIRSLCGASLISSTWVMTAAHCTDGVSSVYVYLGQLDRNNGTGGVSYPNIPKSNIYIHPNWNSSTLQGDLSLIKLPSAVPLSNYPYIKTIRLPKKSETPVSYFDNKNGTASGFGAFNDTSGASQYLLYGPVHIMKNSDCAAYISRSLDPRYALTGGQLCTDKTIRHGGCPGDSGGPVTVQGTDGTPVVVGVASYILGACSDPVTPVVNTFPGFYLNWINQITGIPIVN